ncbi:hypothetical protein GMI69_07785 [Eggerthellaceae bacterium zg-887]|uniref:hypothetical protein n=1 Tax=Xiamenia xianingshaonis TaxID=2682776 RepID=UPI0014073B70|nr:hypothetical protein [Xiamenia xianingshaonis]NHM16555.1 hypothetical protein [Xiamenia xianingshaonis]
MNEIPTTAASQGAEDPREAQPARWGKGGSHPPIVENGEPLPGEVEVVVDEEDGEEYLVAAEPPEVFWKTTEDGEAYVEADDPLARTRAVLDDESAYLEIYRTVLAACAAPGGAKTPDLAAAVDGHPLVQSPRLYVQHFLKKLEDAGAIRWEGAWVAGSAAADVLAELDVKQAASASKAQGEGVLR